MAIGQCNQNFQKTLVQDTNRKEYNASECIRALHSEFSKNNNSLIYSHIY
jgi:hypothetical protein